MCVTACLYGLLILAEDHAPGMCGRSHCGVQGLGPVWILTGRVADESSVRTQRIMVSINSCSGVSSFGSTSWKTCRACNLCPALTLLNGRLQGTSMHMCRPPF